MINIIDIKIFQYSIVPLANYSPVPGQLFSKIFSFISTSPFIERSIIGANKVGIIFQFSVS